MAENTPNQQQNNPAGTSGGGQVHRYHFRQKMLSIGDDYWIENEQGQQVYKVDGKALRIQKTFLFEDAQGKQLAKIKKALISVRETMEISGPDGGQIAVVKKARLTPLREHFSVEVKNGSDLKIQGNIVDHEYTIGEGNQPVAHVSKKWLSMRDSYSVEIGAGQNDVLILAIVVCIDEMSHGTR